MRDSWTRADLPLTLTADELTALVRPVLPGRRVTSGEHVPGGLANTSYRITLAGDAAPLFLRIVTRDPQSAHRDAALQQVIDPAIPTAKILHFAETNPVTGHPFLVMEWIDGIRLETLPSTGPASLAPLGRRLGAILAAIHAVRQPRTGFFDTELSVAIPVDLGPSGLSDYLSYCLVDQRGGERLGHELTRRVLNFAENYGGALDSWTGGPRLTHGDFGGSNILVRPAGDSWEVAAVLDWEFAFAGFPFFDFGNLLRSPLGDLPSFADDVAGGYRTAGGELPPDWLLASRLADLFSWADFLKRHTVSDGLIRDARHHIERTLASV